MLKNLFLLAVLAELHKFSTGSCPMAPLYGPIRARTAALSDNQEIWWYPAVLCDPGQRSGLWRRSAKNDRRLTAAVPHFHSTEFPPVLSRCHSRSTYKTLFLFTGEPASASSNCRAARADVRGGRFHYDSWRTRGKSNARTRAPSSPFPPGSHKLQEVQTWICWPMYM